MGAASGALPAASLLALALRLALVAWTSPGRDSLLTQWELMNATAETKVLLAWTPFFNDRIRNGLREECVRRFPCGLTWDRRELRKAHALIFHGVFDFWPSDLPPWRSAGQRYVFMSAESPEYHQSVTLARLSVYPDLFNWTMTYRSDSDIFDPYANIVRNQSCAESHALEKAREAFAEKEEAILWPVSDCETTNRREKIASALSTLIPIDIVGKCGRRDSCTRNGGPCEEELFRRYFFYLAWENSVCKDYTTEKIFRRRQYFTVPIVLRRSIASQSVPPRSFVAVDDFASLRDLVAHLRQVMSNESAWASYFAWRAEGWAPSSAGPDGKGLGQCGLCHRLHQDHQPKTIPSIASWWEAEGGCEGERFAVQLLRAHFPRLSPSLPDHALLSLVESFNDSRKG